MDNAKFARQSTVKGIDSKCYLKKKLSRVLRSLGIY